MRMSRIVFFSGVDPDHEAGGVAISSQRIVRGLRAAGHHVDLLGLAKVRKPTTDTVAIRRLRRQPIPGVEEWRIGPFYQLGSRLRGAEQTRDVLDCFERWVATRQYDVLIGFCLYPAGLACAWAQERLGIPAIVCAQGTDVGEDLLFGLRSPSIRFALERARQCVFVSHRLRDLAESRVELRSTPAVIHNSIDAPGEDADEERLPATVCYCGVIRERKGIDLLLSAAAKGKWSKRGISLRLVGDFVDARFRRRLRARFPVLTEGESVTVTGWLSRAESLRQLARCTLAVLPSVDEGCPNAMLEAFRLGTPVVASSILGEFFPPHSSHLLFENRSAKQLARRIDALLESPELRLASARRLRDWATERFSPEREIGDYLRIIELSSRRPAAGGAPAADSDLAGDPGGSREPPPEAARSAPPETGTVARLNRWQHSARALAPARIVGYCGDGVGLGHLTRTTALLRALQKASAASGLSVEIFLVTATDSVWPSSRFGLPLVKLPSRQALAGLDTKPSDLQTERLRATSRDILRRLEPDILIVDTLSQGTFKEFRDGALLEELYSVLINRERRATQVERPGEASLASFFDHVVVPHAEDVRTVLATPEEVTEWTGAVLLIERDKMLERDAARMVLGLDPEAFAVLVAPGGLTTARDQRRVTAIAEAVQTLRPDVELRVLAAPPDPRAAKHYFRHFPAAELLPGFDVAIGAAGYNTAYELLHAGLPSALFAKPRRVDDQETRIERLAAQGACLDLGNGSKPHDALERLLNDRDLQQRLATAARQLVPGGGARRAAERILERWLARR